MRNMSTETRHVYWEGEKKGIECILRNKDIGPGDFIDTQQLYDYWDSELFLYPPYGAIAAADEYKLPLAMVNGFPMLVGVSTWAHPDNAEWHGIPCIHVLADTLYRIGSPSLAIRRTAKTIRKLSSGQRR